MYLSIVEHILIFMYKDLLHSRAVKMCSFKIKSSSMFKVWNALFDQKYDSGYCNLILLVLQMPL